jgi:hypothetical protein
MSRSKSTLARISLWIAGVVLLVGSVSLPLFNERAERLRAFKVSELALTHYHVVIPKVGDNPPGNVKLGPHRWGNLTVQYPPTVEQLAQFEVTVQLTPEASSDNRQRAESATASQDWTFPAMAVEVAGDGFLPVMPEKEVRPHMLNENGPTTWVIPMVPNMVGNQHMLLRLTGFAPEVPGVKAGAVYEALDLPLTIGVMPSATAYANHHLTTIVNSVGSFLAAFIGLLIGAAIERRKR